MIDPANITKFGRSKAELQELAIFCILVAGKKARTVARSLDLLLTRARDNTADIGRLCILPSSRDGRYVGDLDLTLPFDNLWLYRDWQLASVLKECGIGCHTNKAKAICELVHADLNLETCTPEDLEAIRGIGPKTARYFLVHSRQGARHAVLDRHVLRFLNEQGHFVAASTPTGRRYLQIEQLVLAYCDAANMTPAEWDLTVWRYYSGEPNAPPPPIPKEKLQIGAIV